MIDTVIRPVIVSGRLDGVEYNVIDWHESTDHRGVWTFCKRRIKTPLEIRIERRIEEARMAEVRDTSIDTLRGEWGIEIVHVD